jgi:hypothetical protein
VLKAQAAGGCVDIAQMHLRAYQATEIPQSIQAARITARTPFQNL